VRTASGATAVQIAEYDGGRRKIVAHVGSAHTEAELGILLERAREMLADPAQGAFDLGIEPTAPQARLVAKEAAPTLFETESPAAVPPAAGPARVVSTDSRLLFQALDGIYGGLGFGALGDDVFRDLVLALVVEPTSVLDAGRVLAELGRKAASDHDHAPHPGPLRGPRLPRQDRRDLLRRSHGLGKLVAAETARGPMESARAAVARATGVSVAKRQLEELACRAAADVEAFYLHRRPEPAPADHALVLTFDGKGVVMLPEALRPATARAAAAAEAKLATRLSPGEKNGRKRMAELACVYDAVPVPRSPRDVIGAPARKRREKKAQADEPKRKGKPREPQPPGSCTP
jgi:hypothetical protein